MIFVTGDWMTKRHGIPWSASEWFGFGRRVKLHRPSLRITDLLPKFTDHDGLEILKLLRVTPMSYPIVFQVFMPRLSLDC